MASEELPSWVTSAEAPKYENRVRIQVFFTRKEGMSQQDFHDYWRTMHAKIFGECPIVKKNLISYTQTHFDKESAVGVEKDGFPLSDYDGIVTFDCESYEKFHEILASKEYQEVIAADEAKFLDRTKYVCFPSKVVNVFDNSK